jgi:hypothetical protein
MAVAVMVKSLLSRPIKDVALSVEVSGNLTTSYVTTELLVVFKVHQSRQTDRL